MALKITTKPPVVKNVQTAKGFNYREWYLNNKENLSKKRAQRYATDPEYRKRALERSTKQRLERQKPLPEGYTISFPEAAERLGISIWTLREWRRHNYFPEPVSGGGRLWFTEHQVGLLGKLQEFMGETRITESRRSDLESLTNLIYANWK